MACFEDNLLSDRGNIFNALYLDYATIDKVWLSVVELAEVTKTVTGLKIFYFQHKSLSDN